MAVDTSYLFRGSNIGPNGIFRDGQNVPEMLYLIQKKFFGLANTLVDVNFTAEALPNFVYKVPNAFPYIHQTKLYSQFVPTSNPLVSNPEDSLSLDPNKCYRDTTFPNFNQDTYFGIDMLSDANSSRFSSLIYPYIAFYSNILLTNITSPGQTLYVNLDTTYANPLLQNAISGYYDYSYTPHLYFSNTGGEITNDNGYWLLDTDVGTITFYDSNASTGPQVSRNNPPRISFFRYEGLFGEANILSSQEF